MPKYLLEFEGASELVPIEIPELVTIDNVYRVSADIEECCVDHRRLISIKPVCDV